MKTINTLLLLLTSFYALAQNKTNATKVFNEKAITFKQCDARYSTGDERDGIAFPYKGGVASYFKGKVPLHKMAGLNGMVLADVIISYNGTACCRAFIKESGNFTMQALDSLGLQNYINAMPRWRIKNKYIHPEYGKSNFSIYILFELKGKQGIVATYTPVMLSVKEAKQGDF